MENKLITLADRLRFIREDQQLTKAELKRKAGLKSASTLTELENGTITDSPQLPKIAAALGVEIMWLQYGTGDMRRPKTKSYELSETAMKIAILLSETSPAYQASILNLIEENIEERKQLGLMQATLLGSKQGG